MDVDFEPTILHLLSRRCVVRMIRSQEVLLHWESRRLLLQAMVQCYCGLLSLSIFTEEEEAHFHYAPGTLAMSVRTK